MSTPLIVNRAPAPGTVGGIMESIRFSVRDEDDFILRNTLQFYLGYGPAFWEGEEGVLPEEDPRISFSIRSRVGSPSDPALRSMDTGRLLLEKLSAGNQEAMYEFGGLQSPSNLDAALMLEFELEMAAADVVVDVDNWTGAFAGIKANGKGVVVKFIDDGTKKVEIHDANPSVVTPPSAAYSAVYDWDLSQAHQFKLLWLPSEDVLRLYVSTGQENTTSDVILIDGLISGFSPLPANELPTNQPIGMFGHGSVFATSKSRWSSVYLYNKVTRPFVNGVSQGEHETQILTDESVTYIPNVLPRKADRPWLILPDSFGAIGGNEQISVEGYLRLVRTSLANSFGFYRIEPKVTQGPVVVDFQLWGRLISRSPSLGPETGLEVYVDDGTKKVPVVFLQDSLGNQTVGFESGPSAFKGWGASALYRLEVNQAGDVNLIGLLSDESGVYEETLVGQPYSAFPASDRPGPGVGFLHNANTVAATAEMFISQLRYSSDVRLWKSTSIPPGPAWVKVGTQPAVIVDDRLLIEDDSEVMATYFYHAETVMSGAQGALMEVLGVVDSYSKGSIENPSRAVTGAGFIIDDGLHQYPFLFADGGPELGKIAFLAQDSDWDANLVSIRAGQAEGTYFSVDWSKFHHYRLEKTVGGNISVYVDQDPIPSLQFPEYPFVPINSIGDEGVKFGSLMTDRKTTSRWQLTRHCPSYGYDIKSLPKTSELRYDHAVNAIVEVES